MVKGIVRKIDHVGRITLPIETREALKMVEGQKIDMWIDGNIIKVYPYNTECLHGIVRRLDELGRVTLPKEYRKTLHMENKSLVDMHFDGSVICVSLVKLQCVCCGSTNEDKLVEKNGVHLCPCCIEELRQEVMRG